jgi:energy-coupling factor transport system permease protein
MSLKILEGFRYLEGNTFVHRLDPRVKMFFALTFMILSLVYNTLFPEIVLLLFVLPFLVIARRMSRWFLTLKGISVLIVFILVLNTIFTTFASALAMCARLIVLISCFSVFFLTVHPDELANALVALKMPYSFSFSISLSFRYVPTLAGEVQTIMEAQKSRGLELEKGGFFTRVKNFLPILVPLVLLSIRRSLLVAESLESRGFGSSEKRTYFQELSMKGKDWVTFILLLALLIVGILVKVVPNFVPAWFLSPWPF